MQDHVIANDSDWSTDRITAYLADTAIPLRLACLTDAGWPFVSSLWFVPDGQELLACVQQDAFVARRFADDPRCGFEVGGDDPPYRGVRGRGEVAIESDGREAVLERLIARYLDAGNAELGDWLRSRIDTEVVLRIRPRWMTAWDYSGRMSAA